MRIIGGKYKGRHIPVRKNFPSRPTTDFAKENLFNILNNHFDFKGLAVLDLFAGTGSIGYEFASRGAKVDLVEKDYRSVTYIKSIIQLLEIDSVKAYKADVFKSVPKLEKSYDIIFADPPYQMAEIDTLPNLILDNKLLNAGGWFILEHSGEYSFTSNPAFNQLRTYGSVNFSIFEK